MRMSVAVITFWFPINMTGLYVQLQPTCIYWCITTYIVVLRASKYTPYRKLQPLVYSPQPGIRSVCLSSANTSSINCNWIGVHHRTGNHTLQRSWRLLKRGFCAGKSCHDRALGGTTHWVRCPPRAGKMLRMFLPEAKLRPVSCPPDHTGSSSLFEWEAS